MERIDFSSLNRGSIHTSLTQSEIKAQPIILPPLGILEHFNGFSGLMFDKFDTLGVVQDGLLPKLVWVDFSQEIGKVSA